MVENPPANAEDTRDEGSILGSERSPRRGNGNPLKYSCLENTMDRGAWWAIVHGVTKSQTWLSTRTHINFSKYNINIIVKYIIYLPFLSVDPVSFIVFFPFNMESSLESGAAFSRHVFFNLIHFFSLPCFLKILTHLKNKICILFSPF